MDLASPAIDFSHLPLFFSPFPTDGCGPSHARADVWQVILKMSKHPIEDGGNEFWKKVRYAAAATVTVGSGIYAVTSVLKQKGCVTSIVDEMKMAMQTASPLLTDATPKIVMQPVVADDESRAVLNMQLQFAMDPNQTRLVDNEFGYATREFRDAESLGFAILTQARF